MNEVFNHLWQSTAFAASMKFLIPFSLLVSSGSRVPIQRGVPAHARFHWEWVAVAIWAVGALFLVLRWFRSWRFVKTTDTLEPGVYGLFRALQMVVETLFWFHPLVWWIGAGLMDERERDCDEAVLRQGSQPEAYARSIVHVCSTYVESPLLCASGIGGADLKKRIRLAFAAVAAVSLPFALGVLRAQTLPPASSLSYDVVSVRKSPPDGKAPSISAGPEGGLRTHDTPVLLLIGDAYGVQDYQIVGAPGWASSQGFDVTFTPDKAEVANAPSDSKSTLGSGSIDRDLIRLQAVLRDRFGLVLRSETRELPIYNLVQAKGGAKLSAPAHPGNSNIRSRGGQLTGTDVTVGRFAELLSSVVERPVRDLTQLSGSFDFKVTTDSDESVFTALSEQVGLKLESAKGPVQVYMVEKIEMPSEN